ncbi:Protocadherin-17 [Chelonia mydas]|uniref:Protocadherin-17 n=1 Tax=Chelonia mydas TaxID=8469 RepID=M7BSG1_CHEMY|nr:Protocadherin-17 [Chelonia mydas]
MDGESGLLYTKQRIDREALCRRSAKCQLSLEVFANDQEICMIKVEIQDLNDNAPAFPSDQVDMDISENAAPGTRFPLTSAHDPDAGDNGLRTYLLTRDDYGLFSLDVKSRGDGTKFPELVIQKPLDREEQSHHTLVLTALDGGDPPRSGTVQLNVRLIDSNDNSPVFEAASYVVELPENAPLGTAVIDLNATDADEGTNGEVLYSFSGYAPERVRDLFSIDPQSGLIRVKSNLDYEESGLIEIDVQARDLGPNPIPAHCKVTVRLIDRNDNAPAIGFVSVRQGALSEAAPPGTVIALVRVTDRDSGKNGQLQCRVLGGGGAGAVPFALEENYDNFYTVVTDRPLDREAQDEYNVTILARDGGSPPLNSTKSFSVRILDENDNPPRFSKSLYVLQVPENNIPGEYLGSVLAQDPDLGQNGTVSYSILPGHVGDVSIYTYVSVNPTNGAIYALRSFNYEQTKHFEFRVLAKDSGSPHRESNATVRVTVLDVNDNAPLIVLPALINDTAELQVPRNAGVGYPVGTVHALDSDFGESGRLTYEIVEGNEEHLFEMDPTSGEIRTLHPYWEELSPVAELVVKVSDHGKPSLSAVAKLIVRALAGPLPEAGEPQVNGEQHRRPHWDLSLPLIVTLSTVSIILLAAMITIAVKCKRENKEIRTYNCRIAEYSHPQLGGGGGSSGGGGGGSGGGGKGKKKKISKNDIMLVPSEGEDSRGPLNVMNVVSSPSLATSPMYFDYQTRLPLSSPRSEVMYLKPASNNLTVPQGHVGCHTSFTGQGTNASEAPPSRMSIIQTDNFPAEPNYMGSRQQFVQSSSTFKDPERASLRDSGHGDSDQADSDQDTNKGSCCDMSVREALKMKTTSTKSQPLEQAPSTSRAPEPPSEEVGYGPYPDSLTPNSPSAPDAIMPPPPQNVDDFKQFQELFKRVALSQDIPFEEVQETEHRLLKILQPSAPSKIALPINEALLESADTLWQIPASILPTCKKAECKYYVPAKDVDFLFYHPQPNSLVVDAATHRMKQLDYRPTPQDEDLSRLDILGHKVYISSILQFRIANYSALLASYDFDNYNKLFEFTSHIPEDRRADFKSVLIEGQLVSRATLQASLDMADTAAHITATAGVMRRSSWLSSSGIPKDLQIKVEDLPFDKDKFFSKKTDKVLHTMKDSRETLGIYPSLPRRQRYQPYHTHTTVSLVSAQTIRYTQESA